MGNKNYRAVVVALKDDVQDISRVCIAIIGKWEAHHSGAFEITQKDLEQMKANFEASEKDLLFDYEHYSLENGDSKASGWGKSLEVEEGKLFCQVEWTPKAEASIKNREYKYLSPVFLFNSKNHITGEEIGTELHSVALTNDQFLKELPAIINKNELGQEPENKGENKMDKILGALGVTTEAEALAKIEELKKKVEDTEAEKEEVENKNEELQAEVTEFQNKQAELEVENAVANKSISEEQKPFALKLRKQGKELFDEYVKTCKETAPKAPEGTLPLKNNNGNSGKAKTWSDYSNADRIALKAENPAVYQKLYDEFVEGE